MKIQISQSVCLALTLVLFGCAGAPPVPSPSPSPAKSVATPPVKAVPAIVFPFDVAGRKQRAIQLAEATDYRSALVQWKILRTLQPEEAEYATRIHDLENLISREIQTLMTEGKNAAVQDNPAAAKQAWLSILALDPNNQTALQVLRAIEEQRVKTIQANNTAHVRKLASAKNGDRGSEDKNQADYYLDMGMHLFEQRDWQGSQREIEKYLSAYPGDTKARSTLARVHQNLAADLEKEGQLDAVVQHLDQAKALDKKIGKADAARTQKIKKTLAEQAYQEALRLPRESLDETIVLLRRAVTYDPDHFKAQSKLAKTLQMQKKLKSISGAPANPG